MSCPEPRVLYLKVLEEGGHRECVHTSYVGEGVTVYRPHVGSAITSVKVVYKNLRSEDDPLHTPALRTWEVSPVYPECGLRLSLRQADEQVLQNPKQKQADISLLKY